MNAAIFVIVFNGILDDIEKDQVVDVPISLQFWRLVPRFHYIIFDIYWNVLFFDLIAELLQNFCYKSFRVAMQPLIYL